MSSCVLQPLLGISNLTAVHNFLFAAPEEAEMEWVKDNWEDEDGGWETESIDLQLTEEVSEESGWIRKCCVAISPIVDCMCFAYEQKAVLLHSKPPTSHGATHEFDISWKGTLSENDGEHVQDVLCVPLVSLKRTSHGSSDWTCVIAGFTSGYVRVFTEAGVPLLSQIFHQSPVVEVRCTTFNRTTFLSHGATDEDELTILHRDALVQVNGFSLFQTMRACRSQLALASASGTQAIEPPPLACCKWKLSGQESVTSHASRPVTQLSPFDHMVAVSMSGGGGGDDGGKWSKPVNQFVTTGTSPYVGVYYAVEGTSQPMLSYVATAVASKLKSALITAASGWLKWGASPGPADDAKPTPKIQPGTPLDIDCGLPDARRRGDRIVLAPGRRGLAAVTDSFGRVLLLDLHTNCALRMWKGYREAQVGFVRTWDDTGGGGKKFALFLVMYAPRRGVLEVWSCVHGPRVAAFNISKHGRLLCPGHGMLGMNGARSVASSPMLQCCLLETDGGIKDVSIPFHLALSDSKSNKAHDIHLLKKITQMVHARQKDGAGIAKLLLEMRLCSMQKQALVKLLQTKRIGSQLFTTLIDDLLDKYSNGSKKEERDLVLLLQLKRSLIRMYEEVRKLNDSSSGVQLADKWTCDAAKFASLMELTPAEASKSIDLITRYKQASDSPSQVRFQHDEYGRVDVAVFLDCFTVEKDDTDGYRAALNQDKRSSLGGYLFHAALFADVRADDVIAAVDGQLGHDDLLRLTLDHWHEHEHLAYGNEGRLFELVRALSTHPDAEPPPLDGVSPRWHGVREDVVGRSRHAVGAYLTSLVSRAIAITRRTRDNQEKVESDDVEPPSYEESCHGIESALTGDCMTAQSDILAGGGGWETVWMELEKWNQLIRQLEDVIALNTCLLLGHLAAATSHHDDRESCGGEQRGMSVHGLLHNGAGHVSELLASVISALPHVSPSLVTSSATDEDASSGEQAVKRFLDFLQSELVPRFPYSLSSNMLHAHCFWDQMVIWNREPDVTSRLRRAIEHLRLITCDPPVERGLALMSWFAFLHQPFRALAKLVDKVGKAPKERLCLKEVRVSGVSELCACATQVLQVIADADTDQYPLPDHSQSGVGVMEENWVKVSGKDSIVQMARSQLHVNYGLVQHNMHLAFILHGVTEFSLRGVKPLSQMFDAVGRRAFGADLTSIAAQLPNPDSLRSDVNQARKQFLAKLVTAAVGRMMTSSQAGMTSAADEKKWAGTAVHMCAEFQLDGGEMHMHYVDQLFSHGLDQFGHEELTAVSDMEVMGSKLMLTVGQRFAHFLTTTSPEDGVILLSQMPPLLTTWIKSQDAGVLARPGVPVESTLELARAVAATLSPDHGQSTLVLYLIDALSAVQQT